MVEAMTKTVPIHVIAEKVRRALRKGTGCAFSHNQLVALTRAGLLDLLSKHEIAELMQSKGSPEVD